MGIFDLLAKAQQALNATQGGQSQKVKKIISMFYADYPEKPYISEDRPDDWADHAELPPMRKLMTVNRSMMMRNEDGLLPGHIYMLYWLKKYKNKSVPAYFEYKYGIDFVKEKSFLIANGYLDNAGQLTTKGESMIIKYEAVIKNHKPPKQSAEEMIEAEKQSLIKDGFDQYKFMANKNCCDICRSLNGKHFTVSELKMGVNAPPMHDGCCCAIAPYTDRKQFDAWLDHIGSGGTMSWEKFNAAYERKQKHKK